MIVLVHYLLYPDIVLLSFSLAWTMVCLSLSLYIYSHLILLHNNVQNIYCCIVRVLCNFNVVC